MPRSNAPLVALAARLTSGDSRFARNLRRAVRPPEIGHDIRVEVTLNDVLGSRPEPLPVRPATPVTDLLHGRLAPGDTDRVRQSMAGSALEMHTAADGATRRRLELNHAAAFGPDDVRARTGLVASMPPEDVHAMARDWSVAGGDLFLADLVADALTAAGCDLPQGGTLLDFGASSGRVLRVFSAARPDVRSIGCDPNPEAIAWAGRHLPGEYVVSPLRPPLRLDDASVDVAYAISIWSHFAAEPAIAWLDELHRVVRRGGALVLTTHGWDQLAAGQRSGAITSRTIAAATAALVSSGHHFVDVFGEEGDWGVVDPGWGNAYFTADWLAARAAGRWSIELLWPGAVDGAQDLFVLRRR